MRTLHSSAGVGAILLSISYSISLFSRTAGTVSVVVLATAFNCGVDEASALATVFFWVYALLQLPAGVLADVLGPRRLSVLWALVSSDG